MVLSDERIAGINRMRNRPRFKSALVLAVLYALIVMSPLAPLALRSATIAHALTGECASDCSICGCSPERSANHTCCCWQKRLLLEHDDHDDDHDLPDCCKKNSAAQNNKTARINSRPCNSSKTMILGGVEQSDVLPFHFCQTNLVLLESALIVNTPVCLTDWPGVPPDPPPKLS